MSEQVAIGGAMLGIVLAMAGGRLRPGWAPALAAAAAAGLAAAIAWSWRPGDPIGSTLVDLAWLPALGSRFVLRLDALGAPLALFTAGLAAPVLAYTEGYLPHHLAEGGRSIREQARFCRLMLAFAGSMVLLMLAHDLVLIFAALELSALVSFLLIEFDRDDADARRAATVALVVTAGSSLLFMAGAVTIAHATGTTTLDGLSAPGVEIPAVALACLALGVIGKSAQVPLHFWLPRAMLAPTPVSAYLHSAALVAAGVFVLARLRVLLELAPMVLHLLTAVGLASIAVGATMALVATGFKRILAWSTIAQYGYCTLLIALGGDDGTAGVVVFLVAHGLAKAALFLTAGAVTSVTGAHDLSETGGLYSRMPALAIASAVATAALAGLPATAGYFKDELFLAAAAHHGPWLAAAAAAAVALTVVYAGRLWLGLFAGAPARHAAGRAATTDDDDRRVRLTGALTWPVAILAAAAVVAGVWTAPFEPVVRAAGATVRGAPVDVSLAYHLAPRVELWLTLAAWGVGIVLLVLRKRWAPWLARVAGPGAAWRLRAPSVDGLGAALERGSNAVRDMEVRDLRDHVSAVLLPLAVLFGLALVGQGRWPGWGDALRFDDLPVAAGLVVAAGAALVVLRARDYLSLVVMLSFVGYGVALTFALAGAPDVALVIVVVETLLTILLLAVLRQLGPAEIARAPVGSQGRGPRAWVSVVAGAAMSVLAWYVLAEPQPENVPRAYLDLAEAAHAHDVVTAILADFRGLDTAGEITVFIVAVVGAAGVAWGRPR